jgi:RNA polymerase sigma-70 factor, ECF subfamily
MTAERTADTFDDFFQRHLPLVRAVALARTADSARADDLTQETFLRAWRHFAHLQTCGLSAQRAWLLRALRHVAVDAHRRAEPAALEETADAAIAKNDPNALLRLDVARALAELDETDREIALLRYFVEMNSREIGEMLGMPEGTVRRRLAVCRERLACRLAAWSEDTGK